MRRALLVLALVLAAPVALAADGPDAVVQVGAGDAPVLTANADFLAFVERGAENVTFRVDLDRALATVEIRLAAGALETPRAQQVVPRLRLDPTEPHCSSAPGACEYTIFEPFHGTDVWSIDGPARVANVTREGNETVLRLAIPGPTNATLVLERDLVAPHYTIGEVTNVTPHAFFVRTTTDELALVDAQVRRVGTSAWVQNPTAAYHVLQNFPIQGLDPASEYELRFVVTDYAGNVATSPTQTVRTPAAAVLPGPALTPLEPAPNSTVARDNVTIRARVDANGTSLAEGGLRLFFDKRPVTSDLVFEEGVLRWTPPTPLAAGLHTVSVEATSAEGGTSSAAWKFTVGGAAAVPLPGALVALALVAAALLVRAARGR